MAHIEDVTFPGATGTPVPAALARPQGDGPHPGVIVIHELFGLNEDIRRIATRFADSGYAAIAPDLYTRGPKVWCVARAMMDLRRGTGTAFEDLDGARRWLAGDDSVDASRIGVAGFCMGGGFALLYAVKAPVGATAPFYGDVPKRAEDLTGVAPVCASYGGRDKLFAPKAETLRGHLERLGVRHDVKVYPEAGHSFMSIHDGGLLERISAAGPMKVGYEPEAAEDAWQRVLQFFGEHLAAG